MTQGVFTVLSNEGVAKDVYKMVISGAVGTLLPGQFVNIKIDGLYLRRPISLCDFDKDTITLIYKTVGTGTEMMKNMMPGAQLDLLVGLGNGFDTKRECRHPLLIGGGVGTPPMYALAKALLKEGIIPCAALGFNTAQDVFYKNEFEALGVKTYVATADGSFGYSGFVTDMIKNEGIEYDFYYACGPAPMLKAVAAQCKCGQVSLEERMACGFGACMGCVCHTKSGAKRVCKDGPVFEADEIFF